MVNDRVVVSKMGASPHWAVAQGYITHIDDAMVVLMLDRSASPIFSPAHSSSLLHRDNTSLPYLSFIEPFPVTPPSTVWMGKMVQLVRERVWLTLKNCLHLIQKGS